MTCSSLVDNSFIFNDYLCLFVDTHDAKHFVTAQAEKLARNSVYSYGNKNNFLSSYLVFFHQFFQVEDFFELITVTDTVLLPRHLFVHHL